MNDNHLQQMLLLTEVAPPQQVWEMIAITLDELNEDRPLQDKILSAEIIAPAFSWDIIEQRLDDVYYTKQLEDAAVEVPPSAWENIIARLNEENDQRIADELIAVKETPPVNSWTAIEEQLNQEQTGRVIPFAKKIMPVYRFAAAAVITGIVVWGAYRLLFSNEPASATVAKSEPAKTEEKKTAPVAEIKPEAPEETIVPVSASRINIKKRIKEELSLPSTIAYLEPSNHDLPAVSSLQNAHHKMQGPAVAVNGFSESDYLVVLNENGELIRVSKKLSNLQCAKNAGELPVDATAALLSKNCDDQIKLWQQKIAASTAISPSAGYIDLNEILLATEK